MRNSSAIRSALQLGAFLLAGGLIAAAGAEEPDPRTLCEQLRAFRLQAEVVPVQNFTLQRDRLQMTFTGQFYVAEPVAGRVTGAVFLGQGRLRAEPWSPFERANLKRLLNADVVDTDFSSAVLRFTDDTHERLMAHAAAAAGPGSTRAQELARELEQRLLKETGLNVSARLALAVVQGDDPGVFFAEFDGGKLGRFRAVFDPQARVLGSVFEVDGGEKGLLCRYDGALFFNEIWTAFYSQDDLAGGRAPYADAFDLVRIPQYRMTLDLLEPDDSVRMEVELDLVALREGVAWLPMRLNEGLSEYENIRLKNGLRVVSAALADGAPVGVIQEEWETGFSLALPRPLAREEPATVKLRLEGRKFLRSWSGDFYYPRSTTTWYPRHGYYPRSQFDLTFRHREKHRAVSVGERVQEGPAEGSGAEWGSRWVTRQPVPVATFAVGLFERHQETAEVGGRKIPLEFYSVGKELPVKEDFLLAEMSNAVRFYSNLFGEYPYGQLRAVYFPGFFGQGLPTLLLLPARGYAHRHEFTFLAHEGAHEWWGNQVMWRSYRDQWLSEGFAEYSAVLYYGWREKNRKKELALIEEMRDSLTEPPVNDRGVVGDGKLYEVGPLVLGHRLFSTEALGAYSALVYNKGGLVLRMLEFLLSDPDTGDETPFFEMMKDFVGRHRNSTATTESFIAVASEHFARSPLGRRLGARDLNWFFNQWVYEAAQPSYRLEYRIVPEAGGKVLLTGTLYQEGVPEHWVMVLPLALEFSGGRTARAVLPARGPATPVQLRLPEAPQKVELDPGKWILSLKTSEKRIK